MNKTYFLFIAIISVNLYSSSLLPLQDYMIKADPNDPFTAETIAKRCSAIYLALSKFTREGDQLYEASMNEYTKWFMIAVNARKTKYPQDDPIKSGEVILESILNIAETVDKEFVKNQDLTGSITEGHFLDEDMVICSELAK